MKTVFMSLILFTIVSLHTVAQDTSKWGLPEGAKARLGKGNIYQVKYSPDGTRLAVGCSSGVWLYDSVTSDPVALIRSGNSFGAIDVVFSRDGSTFAAGAVGIICVWDAVTGEQKHSLQFAENFTLFPIRRFAFSPDGDTLAVGIEDAVGLWDVVTGKRIHTLSGRRFGNIVSLAFSPDGRILASGHESPGAGHSSGSTTIRLWDAETGELKTSLTKIYGLPRSLAFSPDGRTLASGNRYSHIAGDQWGSINLWDVETWELKLVLNPPFTGEGYEGGVLSIAYSPDGRTLASGHSIDRYHGDEFGTVRLWDLETGENIRTLDGHPSDVRSVAFSRDGGTLAIASGYSSLSLWDAATGTQKRQLGGYTGSVSSVAFSPDVRTVARGSWDSTIRLWDAVTGTHKYTLKGHTERIRSIAFSPNSRTLASGSSVDRHDSSQGGTVRLWDTVTGSHKYTLAGHGNSITSVAFSPDGRTLASGGGVVRLYNVATGVHIRTLDGQNGEIIGVAFSPDGNTLASATGGQIRLWHADTGALKHTLNGGSRVVFSPDSRTLAAGGWSTIRLLDTETGVQKLSLDEIQGRDNIVAYSPDGYTLASGAAVWSDKTVRLWDALTGEHIRTLVGHIGDVTSVAFSPDGRTLASGSYDGTVLLWEINPDVENAQVVEPFQITPDVNGDGRVDIQDLVLVAGRLGKAAENREDVNGDGVVNILDLVLVAGMIDNAAGAPLIDSHGAIMLRTTDVKQWLEGARRLALADVISQRGMEYLQNLLDILTPERTAMLPNYPNPFNPETWIPYHLARDSVVRISIYDVRGVLVRQLDLGLKPGGYYTDKHHAAYWDGRNDSGQLLASGVYVYQFRAGSYRASQRMAIVR